MMYRGILYNLLKDCCGYPDSRTEVWGLAIPYENIPLLADRSILTYYASYVIKRNKDQRHRLISSIEDRQHASLGFFLNVRETIVNHPVKNSKHRDLRLKEYTNWGSLGTSFTHATCEWTVIVDDKTGIPTVDTLWLEYHREDCGCFLLSQALRPFWLSLYSTNTRAELHGRPALLLGNNPTKFHDNTAEFHIGSLALRFPCTAAHHANSNTFDTRSSVQYFHIPSGKEIFPELMYIPQLEQFQNDDCCDIYYPYGVELDENTITLLEQLRQ